MTQYGFELLFSEDTPKEIRESIEKIMKIPPTPEPLDVCIQLRRTKLRYLPIIELTAIHGLYRSGDVKKVFEYLSSKVEVKRRRSRFERSRRHHCFWPANVFELPEVKAELELMKGDSFLKLENEDDIKLIKELNLWYDGEVTLYHSIKYRDKLDMMSEEEKKREIWKLVRELVTVDISGYEKILDTYRKFNRIFWFTFYHLIF